MRLFYCVFTVFSVFLLFVIVINERKLRICFVNIALFFGFYHTVYARNILADFYFGKTVLL